MTIMLLMKKRKRTRKKRTKKRYASEHIIPGQMSYDAHGLDGGLGGLIQLQLYRV